MMLKFKLIAAGAILLTVMGLWAAVKYYRNQAIEYKARIVVTEKGLEVVNDQHEREKKVDSMSDDDLLNYWRGMRQRPQGSSPAPAGTSGPGKPDQGQER